MNGDTSYGKSMMDTPLKLDSSEHAPPKNIIILALKTLNHVRFGSFFGGKVPVFCHV